MFEAGQKLGSFEIIRRLRVGGMAELYLARRVGPSGFARPVAIKVIAPRLAAEPELRDMFLDEALLSARIEHPNVVRVEELGEVDGRRFLVMEYVHGCSLASLREELASRDRRMAPALAIHVGIQVLDGLHAAHETRGPDGNKLGVVHRDVSPQNVLLAYQGHVKLIDFGIAKARGRQHETRQGVVRGKLRYMSPEQTYSKPLDARSDVYSFGVVLWELLTGERYFGDTTDDLAVVDLVRNPAPRAPSEAGAAVPAAVDEALLWALSPDREARPPSAMALRRRLAAAFPAATAVDAERVAALLRVVMAESLAAQAELLPEPMREALTGSGEPSAPGGEAVDSLTVSVLAPLPPARGAEVVTPPTGGWVEQEPSEPLEATADHPAAPPSSGWLPRIAVVVAAVGLALGLSWWGEAGDSEGAGPAAPPAAAPPVPVAPGPATLVDEPAPLEHAAVPEAARLDAAVSEDEPVPDPDAPSAISAGRGRTVTRGRPTSEPEPATPPTQPYRIVDGVPIVEAL